MADRACRNFKPNVFNNNKCQNCFKLREAHSSSVTASDASFQSLARKQSAQKVYSRIRTVVKSGVLCITNQDSLDREKGRVIPSRWSKRWFVLNSTGTLDYFYYNEQEHCSTERLDGTVNLDHCSGMFVGEGDTGEAFSIGLKLGKMTNYLKAENRLELDNWSRVLKPFVQASSAYIPRRNSSTSSTSSTDSDVFSSNSTSIGRVPSFGKTSVSRVTSTPLSTMPISTRTPTSTEEKHTSLQLEKLKDENKRLREQSVLSARQKDSTHILEQELKTKENRIKELEKEHSQCKDYQKAVLFQEKELQDKNSKVKDLKQQLEERDKLLQQQKGKIYIHAKELAEAKADLQEANSVIGIHRANIESLKSELSNLRVSGKEKLILAGEEPESDQVFSLKTEANGHEGKSDQGNLESKLSVLMQKLKQNERELLVKSKELEKANESRSKVAKYTRSLLQELEAKLSNNERKLAEAEDQLVNKNLELEYEKERRLKVEDENSRLFSELELLADDRKKDGLSKEVIELLNKAKERVASESVASASITSVEAQVSHAEPKFEDVNSDSASLVKELGRLKAALALAENASEQTEVKLSDSEAVLKSANKENYRLNSSLKAKQQEIENLKSEQNTIESDLKKRENELETLRKELRKLEDRNADVVEKNRELEERLQTVESELTESIEREIFLQTENESDEGERWDVKERIVGLEEEVSIYKDKVHELEAKLSESEANRVSAEADKSRLHELEQRLKRKDDELRENEKTYTKKEKELRKQHDAKREEMEIELNRDKLRLEELEAKLGEVQGVFESEGKKIKKKDNELYELKKQIEVMVYREDAERHVYELESELKDKERKLSECENSLTKANEEIAKCERKLREFESAEKDNDSKYSIDLENKIRVLENELEESREKLTAADEKLMDYEVEEKLLSAELQKSKKGDEEFRMEELRKKLTEAEERIKNYEDFAKDKNSRLIESEEKVIELAEELARRLTVEQETAEWIEGVESTLSVREGELITTRENLVRKAKELDKEKYGILDVMELSMKYIKELELAISDEKETSKELERQLDDERSRVRLMVDEMKNAKTLESHEALNESVKVEEMEERLASCERSREMEASRVKQLQTELEDSKRRFAEELSMERDSHVDEMRKWNEETLQVSGAASSEGDELKLRLTSRVITLQSDISELKASHHQELEKIRAQYKKELENARREAILENSVKEVIPEGGEEMNSRVLELETELKEMTDRYESQMELLKKSHSREMDKLKRSSGDGTDGLQTEVVQLQVEMENMNLKYMEEIEGLKVQHGEELEQLKRDMAVVLQASLGAVPSPAKDDSNVQQLKQRIKDLEEETEQLSRKYNEELKTEREKQQREIEQTRNDMMMVIQAIRSEKYRLDSEVDGGGASSKKPKEVQNELTRMRADYEARIAELEQKHDELMREAKKFKAAVPHTAVDGGAEGDSHLRKRIQHLETELASSKEGFQQQLQQKETKHEEEVNLLKADMLVAIQVARSGITSSDSQGVTGTITHAGMQLSHQEAAAKIDELEKQIESNKKEFKKEKSDLEKSLKKSEAATMFGLRRTENLSIKIYQMQKEMEAIDRKYQKEIKMYKDAFEREKEEKCQMGDWETLASENDSLRLEIEELDLKIEEMESAHSAEVAVFKQKLGDEKMLKMEDLRLKIKGLEDVIEEQKLEHEKELEDLKQERDASLQEANRRHDKELEALQHEQKALNGASEKAMLVTSSDLQQKERIIKDLEFKVEELETLLEVKRRRHKDEIKTLRQRLDDELQKHGEDVRSHRTKVRMLERRKSEHSISLGFNTDDDYKKMYDEQRSENIKLKFTVEKQKKELEELRAKAAEAAEAAQAAEEAAKTAAKDEKPEPVLERRTPRAESRRPVSDSFAAGFSYSRSTSAQATSSSLTKEPLKKAASDATAVTDPVWKRNAGGALSRQASADTARTKPLPRQLSKGVESSAVGSVAARVALYQTAATKFKGKDGQGK